VEPSWLNSVEGRFWRSVAERRLLPSIEVMSDPENPVSKLVLKLPRMDGFKASVPPSMLEMAVVVRLEKDGAVKV